MDEEDLQQMNDDRRLENTDTFKDDGFAGLREGNGERCVCAVREMSDRSLPSALQSLIVPAQTSMGHTLLQKLGWRPGQGIGPRVTLRKLRIQEGKLGRARAGLDIEEEPEEASKHTYAPRDTQLLTYTAKDDKAGLGFLKGRGMGRLPGKRATYGAGPGEDDEEDPYTTTSGEDRTVYAFDDGDDADVIMVGQQSEGSKEPKVRDGNHWHDGRPIMQGFVLDPNGVPKDKWYVENSGLVLIAGGASPTFQPTGSPTRQKYGVCASQRQRGHLSVENLGDL